MATNIDKTRSHLESEKKHLLEDLEHFKTEMPSAEARREGSPFGKREEEATESFELEKRLALERGTQEQLADIDRALRKIEEGTYGLCDVCGRKIDPARLEAMPAANLCMDDKAKYGKTK